VLGATFGAITPFCSCSSVPLFIGFTTARIPLGITMAFLITSPLINEVAVVLLWGLLGWKFTLIYVSAGMLAGIAGGLLMDAIRAERWLQPFLLEEMARPPMQVLMMQAGRRRITVEMRHRFAAGEVRTIFRRVWKWVIIGVALGAGLHGFIPQEWFAKNLGTEHWWTVPAAAALGIPLYTNVTGIVPVMESLLLKGLAVGTTLAFCMSAVAVSLPECGDHSVFYDKVCIIQAFYMIHLRTFKLSCICRKNSSQGAYVVYDGLHQRMNSIDFSIRGCM
jgi:uncharacterized membrane protein YraQ (UPF0718 family)